MLNTTWIRLRLLTPSSFSPQAKIRWFLFGVAWRASSHRIQFLTIRAKIHGKAYAVSGFRPQVKLDGVNADIVVTVVVAEMMILKINILRTLNDNDVMTNEPLTNSPEIIMYFKQTTWFTLSRACSYTHRKILFGRIVVNDIMMTALCVCLANEMRRSDTRRF